MTRALFLHAARDPVASGELNRLAVPAMLLEAKGFETAFAWAPRADLAGRFDVVVVPLEALDILPRLAGSGAAVVVDISLPPERRRSRTGQALAAAASGLAAVVASDAAGVAWARPFAGATPVWLATTPASLGVEVAAAAVRFDYPFTDGASLPPGGFELWFSEPGDHVDVLEVEKLAARWTSASRAVAVAPEPVLAWLAQAGVTATGVPWSPRRMDQALAKASACLLPGPPNESRRRRLARAGRAGAAQPQADLQRFTPHAAADRWGEVLRLAVRRSAVDPTAGRGAALRRARVLFLLDLVQDLDLALPVLDGLMDDRGIEVRVVASAWLMRRSPRVTAELQRRGVTPEVHERAQIEAGSAPDLTGACAVAAIVESSLPAHARAHRLFARARLIGLPTFSFQHGVENIGLNAPEVEGEADAAFLSDRMFAWFSPDHVPATVQPDLRPRLIHVGRPAIPRPPPADFLGAVAGFRRVAAVFENLHWARYSPAWRSRFLADCVDFAESEPDMAVVLKPHHTGLWSVRNRHLIRHWPTNLILADPTDAFWEPYTAPDLIAGADFVLTTPSTVALDAVQAGRPVAVAAYGLEVDAYAPLPLVQGLEDWRRFGAEAGSVLDAQRRVAFLTRVTMFGDAGLAAARHIAEAARRRRSQLRGQARAAAGQEAAE